MSRPTYKPRTRDLHVAPRAGLHAGLHAGRGPHMGILVRTYIIEGLRHLQGSLSLYCHLSNQGTVVRLEMTKKSDLALKAMRCIGDAEGETIAGRTLADKLGITTHYLPQVISPLVKAGWVSSTPGPRGGYRLIVPLEIGRAHV